MINPLTRRIGSAVRAALTARALVALAALTAWALLVADAKAQNSSLYDNRGSSGRPLTPERTSLIWEPPIPHAKPIQRHDIITVIVDESSKMISEGEMDRRKKADGSMVLKDWVGLDGLAVRPDPQTSGDPTIGGEMENKYRAESGLETRNGLKFKIAAKVVDIRPNGNLVLEGHRSIANNEENWDLSICGVVRPGDVMANNTVLSENVAELRIDKRERGHVRDGYRRGIIQKFFDKYQLF